MTGSTYTSKFVFVRFIQNPDAPKWMSSLISIFKKVFRISKSRESCLNTGILDRFEENYAHQSWTMRHRIWKNIEFYSKLKLKNDVVDTELKADLEIFVQINFFML